MSRRKLENDNMSAVTHVANQEHLHTNAYPSSLAGPTMGSMSKSSVQTEWFCGGSGGTLDEKVVFEHPSTETGNDGIGGTSVVNRPNVIHKTIAWLASIPTAAPCGWKTGLIKRCNSENIQVSQEQHSLRKKVRTFQLAGGTSIARINTPSSGPLVAEVMNCWASMTPLNLDTRNATAIMINPKPAPVDEIWMVRKIQ